MNFDDIVAEAEEIESVIKQPARASKQQLDIVALAFDRFHRTKDPYLCARRTFLSIHR